MEAAFGADAGRRRRMVQDAELDLPAGMGREIRHRDELAISSMAEDAQC